MRRIMLTVLGVGSKPAVYRFKDREGQRTALVSPVALMGLMDAKVRPERVLAVVTPQARTTSLPVMIEDLAAIDPAIIVETVDVPDMLDLAGILSAIASRFVEGDELVLDVTHGARHMPFLMYVVSLYLVALKSVHIESAYYAMFLGTGDSSRAGGNPSNPSLAEFVDLKPLLELPRWTYAVASFQQYGNSNQLADLMKERNGQRLPGRQYPLSTERLANRLREVGLNTASGLPIETGIAAAAVAAMLQRREFEDATVGIPLHGDLRRMIEGAVAPFATPGVETKNKAALVLDAAELNRQLSIVKALVRWGHYASAITLLREWFVSWCIWSPDYRFNEHARRWLDRDVRDGESATDTAGDDDSEASCPSGATGFLNELGRTLRSKDPSSQLSDREARLARAWNECREIRNSLAHCGMRKDNVEAKVDRLEALVAYAEELVCEA